MTLSHDDVFGDIATFDFSHIDAVTSIDDHLLYFFIGGNYACYDLNTGKGVDGYPKTIAEGFSGLEFTTIDAVFNSGFGKLYFFSDKQFSRYDIAAKKVDSGYPKSIRKDWSRLNISRVDGVLNAGNGKVYFVSGSVVVRYDIHKQRLDRGYPKSIKRVWPKLGFDYLDGAFVDAKGHGYFFCGGQYIRYDLSKLEPLADYPKPMNSKRWPGINFATNYTTKSVEQTSDVKASDSWIDAVFEHQGKVYFFNGSRYVCYDDSTDNGRVAVGFPQHISRKFYGISLNARVNKLKGCVAVGRDRVHIYYGEHFRCFNLSLNQFEQQPAQLIKQAWPNLTFERIDGVFSLGSHKVYFTCGNRVSRGDLRRGRIDYGYPKFINRQWPGIGLSRITGAFANRRGQSYFFAGNRYTRWNNRHHRPDEHYPRPVNDENWPGMRFEPKASRLSNLSGVSLLSQLSMAPSSDALGYLNENFDTSNIKGVASDFNKRIEYIKQLSKPRYQHLLSFPSGVRSVWLQSRGDVIKADVDGNKLCIGSRPINVVIGCVSKLSICIAADTLSLPALKVSLNQSDEHYLGPKFSFIVCLDKNAIDLSANLTAGTLQAHRQQLALDEGIETNQLVGLELSIQSLAKAIHYDIRNISGGLGNYHVAEVRPLYMEQPHWQINVVTGEHRTLKITGSLSDWQAKHSKDQHQQLDGAEVDTAEALSGILANAGKVARIIVGCFDEYGQAVVENHSHQPAYQDELKRLKHLGEKLVQGEQIGTRVALYADSNLQVQNTNKSQLHIIIVADNQSWQIHLDSHCKLGAVIEWLLIEANINLSDYLALFAKPYGWSEVIELTALLSNMLHDGIGKIADIGEHLRQESEQAMTVAAQVNGQSIDFSLISDSFGHDNGLEPLMLQSRFDVGWFMCHFRRGNYAVTGQNRATKATNVNDKERLASERKLAQGFHYLIAQLEQIRDQLADDSVFADARSLSEQIHQLLSAPNLQNMAKLCCELEQSLRAEFFSQSLNVFKRFSLLLFIELGAVIKNLMAIGRRGYQIPYFGDVYEFVTGKKLDMLSAEAYKRAIAGRLLLDKFDCDLALLHQNDAQASANQAHANQQSSDDVMPKLCRVLYCSNSIIASIEQDAIQAHELLSQGNHNPSVTENIAFSLFIDKAVMQITGALGGELLNPDNPNELGRNIWGYQWTQGLIEAFVGLKGAELMHSQYSVLECMDVCRLLHQLSNSGLLTIGLSNFELQHLNYSAPKVLPITLARCVSLLPRLLTTITTAKRNSDSFYDKDILDELLQRIEQSMSVYYVNMGINGKNPSLIG